MQNKFIEMPASNISLALRNKIFGVGINDANYITTNNGIMCPFYSKWHGMLKRCYSDVYHKKQPTYKDCTTCKHWLIFSNFKKWMITQNWEGMELDKDLLIQSNKIYNSENCIFIPSWLNRLANDKKASRGDFPIGVSFDKETGKFRSRCRDNVIQKSLGRFNSPEEAHSAYVKFKESHVHNIAKNLHTFEDIPAEIIPRLKPALLGWRVK